MFAILFWLSVIVIIYAYFGYPLLLLAMSVVRRRVVSKKEITPSVSIVIAAHNEERIIKEKLENTLSLDYPKERLEVVVASDGSTDRTEEIARQYSERGVQLLPLTRCGKMSALNQAVAHASGEIIAFTDANAMLEEATLKRLVASFADREVGGVCGNQKYRSTDAGDSAGKGENLYWTYDKFLKHLENKVGSIIAADGSIYAIRKNLFVALDDGAQADDFAISVRVITQGRRLVYEPGAISYEEPPAASDNEFRRKIRVTNHSLRGILNVSEALNPLRTGFYAVELWSHKLLRYMAPLFMITAFAANAFLLAGESGFYHILMLGQMLFYGGALAGYMLRHTKWGRLKFFYVPFYFCLVNAAALLGMLSLLKGDRITVWQPQRDITQVGENKR